MKCPRCGSKDIVKKGFSNPTRIGKIQRYGCKKCGRIFQERSSIRNELYKVKPYPDALFNSNRWYLFWQGKHKKSKEAVKEYLKKYGTKDQISQVEISKKYNIAEYGLTVNIKKLRDEGIIPELNHIKKDYLRLITKEKDNDAVA